jgi:hypothetical protein
MYVMTIAIEPITYEELWFIQIRIQTEQVFYLDLYIKH